MKAKVVLIAGMVVLIGGAYALALTDAAWVIPMIPLVYMIGWVIGMKRKGK